MSTEDCKVKAVEVIDLSNLSSSDDDCKLPTKKRRAAEALSQPAKAQRMSGRDSALASLTDKHDITIKDLPEKWRKDNAFLMDAVKVNPQLYQHVAEREDMDYFEVALVAYGNGRDTPDLEWDYTPHAALLWRIQDEFLPWAKAQLVKKDSVASDRSATLQQAVNSIEDMMENARKWAEGEYSDGSERSM